MKKNQFILPVAACICVLAIAGMLLALTLGEKKNSSAFKPPAFDSMAQSGMPAVADSLGWSKIFKEGMSYTAYVCGKVTVQAKSADVYFTDDAQNSVWLKLRILNESGDILGETGLIKPGEYVKSVKLETVPASGTIIKLKIMAYEPDTFYSAGSVTLNTTISKGET